MVRCGVVLAECWSDGTCTMLCQRGVGRQDGEVNRGGGMVGRHRHRHRVGEGGRVVSRGKVRARVRVDLRRVRGGVGAQKSWSR